MIRRCEDGLRRAYMLLGGWRHQAAEIEMNKVQGDGDDRNLLFRRKSKTTLTQATRYLALGETTAGGYQSIV